MFIHRNHPLVALLALTLFLGACGEDSPSAPSEDAVMVTDYVATASIGASSGVVRTSVMPRPRDGAPNIDVSGPLTIVNGGTATLNVTSAIPFETVYVSASAPISGLFVPVTGHFALPLSGPTNSAELVITFPQVVPSADFGLFFSAADAAGNVGGIAELSFEALVVGTGDVQVTVAWNTDADVDLHVVDPSGEEIYWAHRSSASSGQLDLDSNAACGGDGVRNENITWAVGTAPQGTYIVRVDYWNNCEATSTDYTVLMNNGGEIEIFHGNFTGPGDAGSSGSGFEVGTFTRTTGPLPASPWTRSGPQFPNDPTTK